MVGFGGEGDDLYAELWKACAGPLVDVPRRGERVFYFPQGHVEQVSVIFLHFPGKIFFMPFSFVDGSLAFFVACSWRRRRIRSWVNGFRCLIFLRRSFVALFTFNSGYACFWLFFPFLVRLGCWENSGRETKILVLDLVVFSPVVLFSKYGKLGAAGPISRIRLILELPWLLIKAIFGFQILPLKRVNISFKGWPTVSSDSWYLKCFLFLHFLIDQAEDWLYCPNGWFRQ